MIIAGYIAPAENWERFSGDWQAALDVSPKIRFFKLKEAIRSKPNGQFDGFSREQADQRIAMFRQIVERYCVAQCYVAFRIDFFKKHYVNNLGPKWKDWRFKNPYFFAAKNILMLVGRNLQALGLKDEISFVFDDQVKEEEEVISGFRFAQQKWKEWRINKSVTEQTASITFESDEKVLPLQAADMFATMLRLESEHYLAGKKMYPIPGHTKRLPSLGLDWDAHTFTAQARRDNKILAAIATGRWRE